MNLVEYIQHPEKLDAESLSVLQGLVQRYPDFPAARLLLLRNLYQLHHESFGEELRRAALYLPSRRALFQLLESHHYTLEPQRKRRSVGALRREEENDRTQSLIDSFLSALPEEQPRRLTPADAATDYMAYLLQTEADVRQTSSLGTHRAMNRQDLIDDFIGQDTGRIILSDAPDEELQSPPEQNEVTVAENEDYFTETLARIYIKQGKYDKAVEIIRRLSLKYPKKNRYFADQIRFLEKVIINNKHNK